MVLISEITCIQAILQYYQSTGTEFWSEMKSDNIDNIDRKAVKRPLQGSVAAMI